MNRPVIDQLSSDIQEYIISLEKIVEEKNNRIQDLEIKSFMKKYKDKKFAAKCDRDLIQKGCDMLGMEVREVAEICIEGMRSHAAEIGLEGTGAE